MGSFLTFNFCLNTLRTNLSLNHIEISKEIPTGKVPYRSGQQIVD